MKKIFFTLIILSLIVNSQADENDNIFRQKEIKFIKELYEGGRYFDSIAETRKIKPAEKNTAVEYFINTNYFLAGQYSTVINNYNIDVSKKEMQFHSLLLLSGSYQKKKMYPEGYEILKSLDYSILSEKDIFTMFLRRVETLILTGDIEKIDNEIVESQIFLKDEYNFVKLREELQLYKKDGLKSSGCAAAMSAVVPGLGQCYAGYPLEGVISFLSVAAAAAGGVYMKEGGHKSFSNTLFCFSGLFYGGNIYGAYNAAMTGNNEVLHSRHKNIISQYGSYNPGLYIDFESVFN